MHAVRLLCLQLAVLIIDLATAKHYALSVYPPTTTPRPIPTGYVYHSDIQTAYKLSTDQLDWSSARDACIAEGARLAVIDTWKKVQYIVGMRSWLDYVWTGIYRETWGSNWKTINGDPLPSSLPWSLSSKILAVGDCVAVSGLVHGLGNWLCGMQKSYVCEIPGYRNP